MTSKQPATVARPLIAARPNLNGNDLKSMLADLREAAEAIEAAIISLHKLRVNVVHPRNYQTVGDPDLSYKMDCDTIRQSCLEMFNISKWVNDSMLEIHDSTFVKVQKP
jgi:hypothetical protein